MEQVTGYPSFVRQAPENISGLDWWSPLRSGDPEADYREGEAHFDAAMRLMKGYRDPAWKDYYAAMITPELNPFGILPAIIGAMQEVGSIELGFIRALARKAVVGRAPPCDPVAYLNPEAHLGDINARAALAIGGGFGLPDLIADSIIKFIERTFDHEPEVATRFIWVVCSAAAAGALN
jgi:hypothetical protein